MRRRSKITIFLVNPFAFHVNRRLPAPDSDEVPSLRNVILRRCSSIPQEAKPPGSTDVSLFCKAIISHSGLDRWVSEGIPVPVGHTGPTPLSPSRSLCHFLSEEVLDEIVSAEF